MNKFQFMKTLQSILTLAQDSFDRANGALGNAEIGGAWTINGGSVSIVSNQAKGGTSSTTNAATLVMLRLNYTVYADITWYTGEIVSIIARCDSSGISNHMRLRYDGTNLEITKVISGSSTTLATSALSWMSGTTKRLRFSCIGNDFVGSVDGVPVLTTTDDNATKTKYNVGFGLFKSGAVSASTANNFLAEG